MDDRMRQALREVQRDPSLFLQMLDETTKTRLLHAYKWQDLIELLGSLNLDRARVQELGRILQDQLRLDWYTVQGIDLRTASSEQLAELYRLVRMHEMVPAKSRVPKVKHWLVRNFWRRQGLDLQD